MDAIVVEELSYIEISNKKICIHSYIATPFNGIAIIFLNPIFDELNLCQKFMAETARNLCRNNYIIIRFDYFGTGDSGGELCDFNLYETIIDLEKIVGYVQLKFNPKGIRFLGLRMGADIALEFIQCSSIISNIILIEPILNGKKYLYEQRLRRKLFYKINKIVKESDIIKISDKSFEDHLGYPLSHRTIDYLNKWDIHHLNLNNKLIHLYKLDTIFSEEYINEFVLKLKKSNSMSYEKIKCPDFWSSLEPVNTMIITMKISDDLNLL